MTRKEKEKIISDLIHKILADQELGKDTRAMELYLEGIRKDWGM